VILIAGLERAPGELSFEARIGPELRQVWFRTETATLPASEAALAACLLPAMRLGGALTLEEPLDPRLLRSQREFQAIQRARSTGWDFGDPPLREVEVIAPTRVVRPEPPSGRVAAIVDGGVDSWATVLGEPDLTEVIFVDGFDRPARAGGSGADEARLREAASALGLSFHLVRTNLRELSDPLVPWEVYSGCAAVAVAFLFEPLFDRVLITADHDYEIEEKLGSGSISERLWSSEALEVVAGGGRLNRGERTRLVAEDPVAGRLLGGDLLTTATVEALGLRDGLEAFPAAPDLEQLANVDLSRALDRADWEDVLDAARAAARTDLERAIEGPLQRARRAAGLPPAFRLRHGHGPAPSVRVAVIVPAWKQAQYLAGAVASALAQDAPFGVGVMIVDDGCPDPETARIGRALRDADPDRVGFLRQANGGVAAARNAGIRQAIRRWPEVEAFFFLDADNLLSPPTMAALWGLLEATPELAWASPELEMFGASTEGGWNVLGPHLPLRQLFVNQSDTGTLVRRAVFAAGIEFDETMRKGFEDWEFFLRASLAGFSGAGAGRCGFRYRRVPDSMLAGAQEREQQIKASIRRRHRDAYRAGALTLREHAEAPRFALVRCDRADALLLAAADLEPRRVPLVALCEEEQVADAYVLSTAAEVERLRGQGLLAGVLLRLQLELHTHSTVALDAAGERIAIAATPASLPSLRMPAGDLWIERHLELAGAIVDSPLPGLGRVAPLGEVLDSLCAVPERRTHVCGAPLHWRFFQYRHLDQLDTTVPWAGTAGGRTLLALAPTASGEGWDALVQRVAAARAREPDLAAHLILTETPLTDDPPTAPFDTRTCLGEADRESAMLLVERLRAGADLVEDLTAGPTAAPQPADATERIPA
jgi:Glycosyl transferase family 2